MYFANYNKNIHEYDFEYCRFYHSEHFDVNFSQMGKKLSDLWVILYIYYICLNTLDNFSKNR